jgi:hypothetical protein
MIQNLRKDPTFVMFFVLYFSKLHNTPAVVSHLVYYQCSLEHEVLSSKSSQVGLEILAYSCFLAETLHFVVKFLRQWQVGPGLAHERAMCPSSQVLYPSQTAVN